MLVRFRRLLFPLNIKVVVVIVRLQGHTKEFMMCYVKKSVYHKQVCEKESAYIYRLWTVIDQDYELCYVFSIDSIYCLFECLISPYEKKEKKKRFLNKILTLI